MALIELRDVRKAYAMGKQTLEILHGISLSIEAGEFVAIMGPSGSGKSTLMHILGLLDVPTSGSYRLDGRETASLSTDDLAVLRRGEVGFVFQQFNLLPRMSARDNVALPQYYSRGRAVPGAADGLLEKVGLAERADHHPNELSGGQQQRVAIARSLVNAPRILFADEPTGNLDSASEAEVLSILRDLNARGITVILVTHEEEIARNAHRVIRIRDGRIQSDESDGSPPARASAAASPGPKRSARALAQHFAQAGRALMNNKVRSLLSVLGILIGVAAVVTMLAIGSGAKRAIEDQLSSLGSNLLVLRRGSMRMAGGAMGQSGSGRLDLQDAEAIRTRVPGVVSAAPTVDDRAQLTFVNRNWNTSIMGVTTLYPSMRSLTPRLGRFFNDDEVRQRQRVALVGQTIVREVFDGRDPIGENIRLNKVPFRVIGVLPPRGGSGFRDEDDVVFMPITTAMHRLLGQTFVDGVDIQVDSSASTGMVQQGVERLMIERHRIPPARQRDAFQVRNLQEIQDTLSSTTRVMTLLLSMIAAISLVVGGIGIMNIMLVSVTERTREIGLRKAVGARSADILWQFLVESIVVSSLGGILGILLSQLAVLAVNRYLGWATRVTGSSILLSLAFSTLVGVVFGLYPARRAAALHPIQALRYE